MRTASGPFLNFLVLCPETKTCPEAAVQAVTATATQNQANQANQTNQADQADQTKQIKQTIRKSFQNDSELGFDWLHLRRSEWGPKSKFGRLIP